MTKDELERSTDKTDKTVDLACLEEFCDWLIDDKHKLLNSFKFVNWIKRHDLGLEK